MKLSLTCSLVLLAGVGATSLSAQTPERTFAQRLSARAFPKLQGAEANTTAKKKTSASAASGFRLNGVTLNDGDDWDFSLGFKDGGGVSPVLSGTISRSIFGKADTYVDGGSLYIRHKGWVFQLVSSDKQHVVRTANIQGGVTLGYSLAMTATGKCFLPGSDPDQYCNYIPGIESVDASIDRDLRVPTKYIMGAPYGAVISRELHEHLKQDGFQRSIDGQDPVGVDLYFPNAGFVATPAGRMDNRAYHDDIVRKRYVPTFSRVESTIRSGSTTAAADRTIRSVVLLNPGEWTEQAAALQLVGWLLPSVKVKRTEEDGYARASVANTIFRAMDNAWAPTDGLTVFQTGVAQAKQLTNPVKSANELPRATYVGAWLGFTPVASERTVKDNLSFTLTGDDQQILGPFFRQGGGDFGEPLQIGLSVFDQITGMLTPIDFATIPDVFVQLEQSVTSQGALRRITHSTTTTYEYVPHASVNANVTTGTMALRGYGGALLVDDPLYYVGADFSFNSQNGWNAYLAGQAYSKQTISTYNKVEANLSKTFKLGKRELTVGLGGSKPIEGPTANDDAKLALKSNSIEAVMRLQNGPFDISLSKRFVTEEDDSGEVDREATSLNVIYGAGGQWSFNAGFTPKSDESAYVEAAVGASWRPSDQANAPVLGLQISKTRYTMGMDDFGSPMVAKNTTFLASMQAKF